MTGQKAFRLAAWFCFAAIVVLSLVSPSLRPVTWLAHSLEHAAIFALAGLAIGLGYPGRVVWHLIGLAIFAAAIELAQYYVPGRHPRLTDFAIDTLGAGLGVLIAAVVMRLWTRTA
jgi:VanZ family protein